MSSDVVGRPRFCHHSYDYRPNRTPLSPLTGIIALHQVIYIAEKCQDFIYFILSCVTVSVYLFVKERAVTNFALLGSKLGRFRLATNYPAVMGRKLGDPRYFRGAISCLQLFRTALNGQQIRAVKNKCFRRSKLSCEDTFCYLV